MSTKTHNPLQSTNQPSKRGKNPPIPQNTVQPANFVKPKEYIEKISNEIMKTWWVQWNKKTRNYPSDPIHQSILFSDSTGGGGVDVLLPLSLEIVGTDRSHPEAGGRRPGQIACRSVANDSPILGRLFSLLASSLHAVFWKWSRNDICSGSGNRVTLRWSVSCNFQESDSCLRLFEIRRTALL